MISGNWETPTDWLSGGIWAWVGLVPQRHPRKGIVYLCSLPSGQDQFDCPVTLLYRKPPWGSFKFSPAAQAADSGLYGSHNVVPAVARDNEARGCGYRGVFSQSRDCFLSRSVHRLENHQFYMNRLESSWASDLCSLNSSFPINQNPDA